MTSKYLSEHQAWTELYCIVDSVGMPRLEWLANEVDVVPKERICSGICEAILHMYVIGIINGNTFFKMWCRVKTEIKKISGFNKMTWIISPYNWERRKPILKKFMIESGKNKHEE